MKITDEVILMTAIIATLIAGLVGLIGILTMYHVFPIVFFEQPTCECPSLQESYDRPRQLFSVLGFFFAFIPAIVWRVWIWKKLQVEEKIVQ